MPAAPQAAVPTGGGTRTAAPGIVTVDAGSTFGGTDGGAGGRTRASPTTAGLLRNSRTVAASPAASSRRAIATIALRPIQGLPPPLLRLALTRQPPVVWSSASSCASGGYPPGVGAPALRCVLGYAQQRASSERGDACSQLLLGSMCGPVRAPRPAVTNVPLLRCGEAVCWATGRPASERPLWPAKDRV